MDSLIHTVRNVRVMLDRDLAALYGVTTSNLNKAVRRNKERFPSDFMFQLTLEENRSLRFQSGTLKRGEHAKYLGLVFTEQGVAMLSSVLRSRRAVRVNIGIMRAFVRLRQLGPVSRELTRKLAELEGRIGAHDESIAAIFEAMRELTMGSEKPSPKIGFRVEKK